MSAPFPIDEFLEHREHDTFTFPLNASSIGRGEPFRVTCRWLQIMDRASLGFLPGKLQNRVWSQLKATQREVEKRQAAGQEPKDITEALANIDDQLKVADILCEYGWLDPKVTRAPEKESRDAGVIYIGRFAAADRIAYLLGCNDTDGEQARHFRVFRNESRDDVPGGEDREDVGQAAERGPGDGSTPVPFNVTVSDQ